MTLEGLRNESLLQSNKQAAGLVAGCYALLPEGRDWFDASGPLHLLSLFRVNRTNMEDLAERILWLESQLQAANDELNCRQKGMGQRIS